MFWWREHLAGPGSGIGIGFTDASIDLAESAPERDEDLARLVEFTGVDLVRLDQVHGATVALIEDLPQAPPAADAAITDRIGVGLLTRAADCVPVLLADPIRGILGVAHSGREGTLLDVAGAAVRQMRERGADRVFAWVGPHVCGACYEVPEPMRAELSSVEPDAHSMTSWGTPALDLGAAVAAQLRRAGAEVESVTGCTREESRLHSYRRDGGRAGRIGGVVWRR